VNEKFLIGGGALLTGYLVTKEILDQQWCGDNCQELVKPIEIEFAHQLASLIVGGLIAAAVSYDRPRRRLRR
jgi:hypothetical protein